MMDELVLIKSPKKWGGKCLLWTTETQLERTKWVRVQAERNFWESVQEWKEAPAWRGMDWQRNLFPTSLPLQRKEEFPLKAGRASTCISQQSQRSFGKAGPDSQAFTVTPPVIFLPLGRKEEHRNP